jgi:hypothetical protein
MTKYPPWFVLLLIKLAVLHCDPSHPKKRNATIQDFNRLINVIHEIFGCVRLPRDYDNVFLFLKNMAFQQFWLQQPLSSADLGRQIWLFEKLATSSRVEDSFKEHLGLPKYFSGRQIKRYYRDSLLVDYLLPFSGATVVLESKGIK